MKLAQTYCSPKELLGLKTTIMKYITRRIALLLLFAALLTTVSSCRTQQGCPNNFSIETGQ